jgi:hypothetical protein
MFCTIIHELVQALELVFGYTSIFQVQISKKQKPNLQNPQNVSIAMVSTPKVV